MDSFSLVLAFVFGTIVGSFLNVVALRFNTGKGIGGRSACMSCGKQLTWSELIPVFSFLFQRGACKKCLSKISWQYPLVEFSAGVAFVLIFFVFPPVTLAASLNTLLYVITTCVLIVIAAYDFKHKIIPDQFVVVFILLSIVHIFMVSSWHVPNWELLIAGPALTLPFAFTSLISRGTWMGWGDAKLVVGIGWFLGISAGINAVVLSFWIGAVISLIWLFSTYKRFKPRTEIPFGPYLILGMYLVLLFGIQVIDVHMLRDIVLSNF